MSGAIVSAKCVATEHDEERRNIERNRDVENRHQQNEPEIHHGRRRDERSGGLASAGGELSAAARDDERRHRTGIQAAQKTAQQEPLARERERLQKVARVRDAGAATTASQIWYGVSEGTVRSRPSAATEE